ncbi:hypothetical protein ACHAXR_013030 [Thalassiosira sp. AJA248-18]
MRPTAPSHRRRRPATASAERQRRQPYLYLVIASSLECTAATAGCRPRHSELMSAFVSIRSAFHSSHHDANNRPDHGVFDRKLPRYFSPLSLRIPTSTLPSNRYPTTTILQRKSSTGNNDEPLFDEESNNGLYLNEGTYLQAEESMLRSDGSLNLNNEQEIQDKSGSMLMSDGITPTTPAFLPPVPKIKNKTYQSAVEGLFSPPPSYSYSSSSDNNGDDKNSDRVSTTQQQLSDEEILYQTVMDIESGKKENTQQMIDSETLHQQVFSEEQTYFEQSETFRKSLSSLYDSEKSESPMAKERREIIEQYNEKVLDDLMKEMDEVEEEAVSREEAMRQAKEEVNNNTKSKNNVLCSKCGLRVTPDVIEHAEMMDIFAAKGSRGGGGGGGVQKKRREGNNNAVIPSNKGILCQACYVKVLTNTVDEARVRLGAGQSGYEYDSSAAGYSWRQSRTTKGGGGGRGDGKQYYKDKKWRKKGVGGDGNEGGRSSNVQGISTSSLFDMPKGGYNVERKGGTGFDSQEELPKTSINSNRPSSNDAERESSSGGSPQALPQRSMRSTGTSSAPKTSINSNRRSSNNAESKNTDGSTVPKIPISTGSSTPKPFINSNIPSSSNVRQSRPPGTGSSAPKTPINSNRRSSPNERQSRPPRRTSRALGGGELVKRMQRLDSNDDADLKPLKPLEPIENTTEASARRAFTSTSSPEDSSSEITGKGGEEEVGEGNLKVSHDNSDPWVRIEDPGTQRMFYWNTETGEMKKTLD